MLRFDLELKLLDGSLHVKDHPEAWRAEMSATLGLVPSDDRDGCLHDVHWFSGGIGAAFQSLHDRQILSVQLCEAACKTHPQIPSEIEVGKFCTLHEWLKSHLFRHGRKYRPNELMKRLVGGLSVQPTSPTFGLNSAKSINREEGLKIFTLLRAPKT